MKNPQLKGRDSKVVRLIRNSCPFITNFGHVWSDQTRVTHLQNVLCVIRTSVVLILDDMIVKDIGYTWLQEGLPLYIFIVFIIFYFYDEFLINFHALSDFMLILCILNCVQSFLFVLAFRLRQSKMFDASYDGLHLSTQNYTYPH